jgi:hypothetical protein
MSPIFHENAFLEDFLARRQQILFISAAQLCISAGLRKFLRPFCVRADAPIY